jgi:gluconate 2-dehydrogenase alpha chain
MTARKVFAFRGAPAYIAAESGVDQCGASYERAFGPMSEWLTSKAAEIAKAIGPSKMNVNPRRGKYTIVPYQSAHNTGGTVMGADPNTSVVNKYLQSWDVHNLFVVGAGNFPQNIGYNPTGTVGALTYQALEAIRESCIKRL